jgi:hypothetical protein
MLSRQQEGSDCGVTARTVWRWEHGTRPLARYRRLLCALYDASSEELGFRVTQPHARPKVVPQICADTVSSQIARSSPYTRTVASRAGVESVLQAFRAADRQVGGGYLYDAAIRYLTCEVEPELRKSTPAAYPAAAALTEMAGWMAHDAGHDGLAQRHFDRAVRLASSTGDVELTAHIHASVSHLAQVTGRPHEALQLAQAGREILRRKEHGPAIAARLHAMEARALASLAQRSECERMLFAAERTLDRRPSQAPSPWMSPFDHASLAGEASQCMEQLRQFAAAGRHCERAISLRGSGHVRSRAFSQLRLANILATQGEIDHACAIAVNAIASTAQLSSHRVSQLLHSLYAKLLPHMAASGVAAALGALSSAMATRVPEYLLIDTER